MSEQTDRQITALRKLAFSDEVNQFRDEAAFGRAVLPYASNRYLRLLDAMREVLNENYTPTPELEEASRALEAVSHLVDHCENFVSGNCAENGRDLEADYAADGYCLPCKVRHAITRAGGQR